MARPSKFNERMLGLIEALAREGKSDNEIAVAIGISPATLNLWKSKHPGFLDALEAGKEVADDLVEATLFKRAVGWSQPMVKAFYNAKLDKVVEHRMIERSVPDVTACIHWLRCRRPDTWREVTRQEMTGADGSPLASAVPVQIVVGLPENQRQAVIDVAKIEK